MSLSLLLCSVHRQVPAVVSELAPTHTVPAGITRDKYSFSEYESMRTRLSPLAEQAAFALACVVRPMGENTPQNQYAFEPHVISLQSASGEWDDGLPHWPVSEQVALA